VRPLTPVPSQDALTLQVVELERSILRALCSAQGDSENWRGVKRELANYEWRESDHAVVFRAIGEVRSRSPKDWRAELAAQATRMGFPDLDWGTYLGTEGTKGDLGDLMSMLRAMIQKK
jgi:hypothetical protein